MSTQPIQFVPEHPETDHLKEKRPRIVFSCDSCRSRKVKCVPRGDNGPCNTCHEAKLKCRYGDKARYQEMKGHRDSASRSSGSSSSSRSARRDSPFNFDGSTSSGSPNHSPTASVNYSAHGAQGVPHVPTGLAAGLPAEGYRSTYETSSTHSSTYEYTAYPTTSSGYMTAANPQYSQANMAYAQSAQSSTGSTGSAQAATVSYTPPTEGPHPHSALMPSLLQAFFTYRGSMHAFLVYEDIWQRFQAGRLDPALSNAIAGLALPYAPEVVQATGQNADYLTNAYIKNAQNVIHKNWSSSPSLSILYATILVATVHASGNTLSNGFKAYAEHALNMAKALQLNSDASVWQLAGGNPNQMARLRAAWESITQLFPANRSP